MRRLVLLLALAPAALGAQTGYPISLKPDLQGDSAIALLPGGTASFALTTSYDFRGYGLDSFAVRVFYDPTALSFTGALKLCPDTTAPLHAAPGANYVDVSSAHCAAPYFGDSIVRLTFHYSAAGTTGALISLLPLAALDNGNVDRLIEIQTDVAEVCHASGIWGDVTGDDTINSLDALVALSYAVGLPTGSYNPQAQGDVDRDGYVTSRDALMMLSAAIGLPTPSTRTGEGVADRCAPAFALPRASLFARGNVDPGLVASGSGLASRAANDTLGALKGDSADMVYGTYRWRPRVSHDGTRVLFVCDNPYYSYPGICMSNIAGDSVVHLTPPFGSETSPDWSPNDSEIVYVSGGYYLYVMNADTTNKHQIPDPATANVQDVAWSPVAGSQVVAYTTNLSYGEVHTTRVDTVGFNTTLFTGSCCTLPYYPQWVDWNVAGDSVVFSVDIDNTYALAALSVATGGPLNVLTDLAPGASSHPVWTDQGILFDTYRPSPNGYQLYLRRPDGSLQRLARDTKDNVLPGMTKQ